MNPEKTNVLDVLSLISSLLSVIDLLVQVIANIKALLEGTAEA